MKKEQDVIISVNNLKTYFYTNQRCNKAINGVSREIKRGKTLCVVGESGCGKSVTATSIMQLLPKLSRCLLYTSLQLLLVELVLP